MFRRRLALSLFVTVGLSLASATGAQAASVGVETASLSGSVEVPVVGPAGATGYAIVETLPDQGLVCYVVVVSGITLPAAAAHIHRGADGVAGPVVIPLIAPGIGGASGGCTDVAPALVLEIQANPQNFYVNVHNAEFPGGADRGKLEALF